MNARIEFWGGVGVIGSSKVLVHDGDHRVLLDLGLDIPREGDLFRAPARIPADDELRTRLATKTAAAIPGIYDPSALGAGDPLADTAGPTAVFISHPHIDHVGLAGFVRPEIAISASPDALALLTALDVAGEKLAGPRPLSTWQAITAGQAVRHGPMTIERFDVDHDVPGASGYRVTTSDGVLAFTGDIRFHGHHPERSLAFTEAVKGCDVLVTEGTTLSFDEYHPLRTERDVAADYEAALAGRQDLMLQSVYPRDLDRVRAFLEIAAARGRVVAWPAQTAVFLAAAGVPGVVAVDPAAVRADPGGFVVQLDPGDLPFLLDLPIGPGSAMLHANGEPLGPFDPRWSLYTDWLRFRGLPLVQIGCSGHAYQDDLHEMVYRIRPRVVVPIHTRSPYRLHPAGGPHRLIVDYAQSYDFNGNRS
jgi:ribonuclease J